MGIFFWLNIKICASCPELRTLVGQRLCPMDIPKFTKTEFHTDNFHTDNFHTDNINTDNFHVLGSKHRSGRI